MKNKEGIMLFECLKPWVIRGRGGESLPRSRNKTLLFHPFYSQTTKLNKAASGNETDRQTRCHIKALNNYEIRCCVIISSFLHYV